MSRFRGRVVIVTGGAQGMGESTARIFAAGGATVVITDVLVEKGQALAADMGGDAVFSRLDVSDEANWAAVVADTLARFGRGKGVIVNISSVDGLRGVNGLSAYTASKWGLRGLTKTQALEVGPSGIRVCSVHPGGVDTALGNHYGRAGEELQASYQNVQLRRIGLADEVARVTAFVASDDASYMNGAELAVDGGWSAGTYYPGLPGTPG